MQDRTKNDQCADTFLHLSCDNSVTARSTLIFWKIKVRDLSQTLLSGYLCFECFTRSDIRMNLTNPKNKKLERQAAAEWITDIWYHSCAASLNQCYLTIYLSFRLDQTILIAAPNWFVSLSFRLQTTTSDYDFTKQWITKHTVFPNHECDRCFWLVFWCCFINLSCTSLFAPFFDSSRKYCTWLLTSPYTGVWSTWKRGSMAAIWSATKWGRIDYWVMKILSYLFCGRSESTYLFRLASYFVENSNLLPSLLTAFSTLLY